MDHVNGWLGIREADKAFSKLSNSFCQFRIVGDDNNKPGPPIWKFTKRLNKGKHIKTWYQEIGDCVSMGAAQAGNYLSAAQIVLDGSQEAYKLWYPPYIYGVSRTAEDCGNGQLGRGDGSLGSWAAVGLMNHGVLFEDDAGVPEYSGSVASAWGYRGVPKEFYDLASDNLVKSAARLETLDELRSALINYYPCTIASSWGFTTSVKANRVIYVRSGSWMHQMCFIAWQDDPFPAAYRLNSWGPDSTPDPLNGEPAGGAWQPAESIERELSTGVEVYALSRFDGFPAKRGVSFI